jgi:hypothetical protein
MVGSLLDLDHIALRVAPIHGLHVTGIHRVRSPEGHPQGPQALVLPFDVRDVDAKMRVALVEGTQRPRRDRLRGAEFEKLHVAAAGAQHGAPRRRPGHVQQLIEHRGVAPAEFLSHHLEPERVSIELNHAVQVANVNGHVMYASDHEFLL